MSRSTPLVRSNSMSRLRSPLPNGNDQKKITFFEMPGYIQLLTTITKSFDKQIEKFKDSHPRRALVPTSAGVALVGIPSNIQAKQVGTFGQSGELIGLLKYDEISGKWPTFFKQIRGILDKYFDTVKSIRDGMNNQNWREFQMKYSDESFSRIRGNLYFMITFLHLARFVNEAYADALPSDYYLALYERVTLQTFFVRTTVDVNFADPKFNPGTLLLLAEPNTNFWKNEIVAYLTSPTNSSISTRTSRFAFAPTFTPREGNMSRLSHTPTMKVPMTEEQINEHVAAAARARNGQHANQSRSTVKISVDDDSQTSDENAA